MSKANGDARTAMVPAETFALDFFDALTGVTVALERR
mgnify:CR=1 FL=1